MELNKSLNQRPQRNQTQPQHHKQQLTIIQQQPQQSQRTKKQAKKPHS